MDSFGHIFRITDGGDTHGASLWGEIEGCPRGLFIDENYVKSELQRRSPNENPSSTRRRESDKVVFESGILNGYSTGEKIRFHICNEDVKINESNRYLIKPSHASYVYMKKYGFKDNELCGRASARQTSCRVVAGAIAKLWLNERGISFTSKVVSKATPKGEGDSVGALVECTVHGLPAGLGEPVYDKFSARLAYAMMSINAAKSFELGAGVNAANMSGSEYHDIQNPDFSFQSNNDGGVQAGITNGEDVYFRVAFKPIPSVRFDRETVDYNGNRCIMRGSDRNDLCVAPRVLPVVEAMAAIVTIDFMLL